jgi:Protein of unknown function (DUF4238)
MVVADGSGRPPLVAWVLAGRWAIGGFGGDIVTTSDKKQMPVRQHTVPQAHLRRFANGKQVRVYPRDGRRTYLSSLRDVAAVNYFYALEVATRGRAYNVETDVLKPLDDAGARSIARILSGLFPPSADDRENLALYMAMQLARTLESRDELAAMGDAGLRRAYNDTEIIPGKRGIPTNVRVVPSNNFSIHLMLTMALSTFRLLQDRAWVLAARKVPSFFTSDHPIVYQRDETPETRGLGIGVATADQIWFALDRRHVLVLFRQGASREGVMELSQLEVDQVNMAVAADSYEYIYAHPDDKFVEDFVPNTRRPVLYVNDEGIYWDR